MREFSFVHEGKPPELGTALEECLHRFWEAGEEVAGLRVLVVAPTAPEELRKRLRPLPLLEGQEDFTALLSERYRTVSQRRRSWPSGRGVHPDSYRALLWSVLSDNRGI